VKRMEEKNCRAERDGCDPARSADVPAEAELEQVRGERDQFCWTGWPLQAIRDTRRREVKERQDARDYAVQNAVERSGRMDNFQLALKSDGTLEQLAGGGTDPEQMEEALRG